jgi:hypothetical protein
MEGGGASDRWEVLSLSPTGELAATGTEFSPGRATTGRVAFTPDGGVGVAVFELAYDPGDPTTPFAVTGELSRAIGVQPQGFRAGKVSPADGHPWA